MRRVIVLAGSVTALLFAAAPAYAEQYVIAGPAPSAYLTTSVTIDQGESLTFVNFDALAPHDVTATDLDSNFFPRFQSETINVGTTPVSKAETLTTGRYGFFCSIHPFMQGTLTVSSEGTPVGGGNGGGDQATKASAKVRSSVKKVIRSGKVKVEVKTNGSAKLKLKVKAKAGKRSKKIAAGKARATSSGKHVYRLKVSKKKRKFLKRNRDAKLKASAKLL